MSNRENLRAYAVRLKEKEKLKRSSSGGAFVALAIKIIDDGGAVVSTKYNYKLHRNEFELFTDKKSILDCQGSKYVQAYPKDVFNDTLAWAKDHPNKKILFVGMGCQADAFRLFCELKGIRSQTIITGIVCHGVPSPLIWKEYIANKQYDYVNFRDKRYGWDKSRAIISIKNRKSSIQEFMGIYATLCAIRPSCYECPYATIERNVDITIGDYWGVKEKIPDFYSSEGVSLVLVHSTMGRELLERVKDLVDWKENDINNCLQPNLVCPTKRPSNRNEFWDNYRTDGIEFILKKYVGVTMRNRMKSKIKMIIEQIFGGGGGK